MRLPPIGIIAEPPSCDETSCEMTVPNWIAGFVFAAAGKQHRSNKTAIFITLISASHPNNLRVKIMISRLLMAVALLCAVSYGQVKVSPLLQPHQTFVDQGGCAVRGLRSVLAIPPERPRRRLLIKMPAAACLIRTRSSSACRVGPTSGSISSLTYKFVLKNTSGTTLWTVDNIAAPGAGSISSAPLGSQSITQPPGTNFGINTSGGGKFLYNGSGGSPPRPPGPVQPKRANQTVTQPANTTLKVTNLNQEYVVKRRWDRRQFRLRSRRQ